MNPEREPQGMLLVDKPAGPTSHDLVSRARRTLGTRRVGHTGTLDPFASGLLLLLFGPATRLAETLTSLDKEYSAVARLGVRTTTDDPEGEATETGEGWREVSRDRVERDLASFLGASEQVPPAYSAKKIGGRPAHRRVRAGEEVELPPAPIFIHEAALEGLELPLVRFRLRCSPGTYVRAIARDLGEILGVGAHLVELRRTAIGPFRVEDALPAEDLDDPERARSALLTPLQAAGHLPRLELQQEDRDRIRMGQSLSAERYPELGDPSGEFVLAEGGQLVALALLEAGRIRPRKVFPGG